MSFKPIDPNAHAEALANLLHKMTQDAHDQADVARSSDPNILAQSLESNGDPTTMPKSETKKDEQHIEDVPVESPNDTAEKLQKELTKAMNKSDETDKEIPDSEKPENKHVESVGENDEEKVEKQEHVDNAEKADPETLKVDFSPPTGTSEGQDSSWQRPDVPSEWHNESESGPEGSWPSAVYDPENPSGTVTEEGTSGSTDAPADWGTYDDAPLGGDTFLTKKTESKPESAKNEKGVESPDVEEKEPSEKVENVEGKEELVEKVEKNVKVKEEPVEDVGGGADGDVTTWDHDDDPSTPEIVIKGAKFGSEHPKKEDVRTQDVIIAHHIDLKRDDKVGVALSSYNLNYVFAEPDTRDHKFRAVFGAPDVNYLPATSDLRPTWGPILDQLDLGSCVSNSVSYCIRYCFKKQKLGEFTPSRLFIYYNGRQIAGYPVNEDTGLTIRDGFKSVTKFSVCSEKNWPYVPNKFSTRPPETCYVAAQQHKTFRYISLDNDAAQIKKCLKDGFPVAFGTALFDSFMSTKVAQTGIVPMPNAKREQRIGGHAMTIIGHDDAKKAFLVVNNWGAKWGMAGCCFMPYDYITNDDYTGDLWSPRYFGA